MSANAARFQPTLTQVSSDVATAAEETIDQRIRSVLGEQGDQDFIYIRPCCPIATLVLAELRQAEALRVPCPQDELRRANLPPALRSQTGNCISLYPVSDEAYILFATRMLQAGSDDGQYHRYTYHHNGGWYLEEHH